MPPQMILLKSFLISTAIRKKWLIPAFLWHKQHSNPYQWKVSFEMAVWTLLAFSIVKLELKRLLNSHTWLSCIWTEKPACLWKNTNSFLHTVSSLTVRQFCLHCLCHPPSVSQKLVMVVTPSPLSDKHTWMLCRNVIQQAWEGKGRGKSLLCFRALFLFD